VSSRFPRALRGALSVSLLAASGCAHTNLPEQVRQAALAGERPACRPAEIVDQLEISWLDRQMGAVTTPFKYAGISGWEDTGCTGQIVGVAVRDAAHSSGGMITIDVQLKSVRIGDEAGMPGRYLRIEVERHTKAHRVCRRHHIKKGTVIAASGPVVFDEDGPFLEIHPDEDFQIVR
jgi:hypothetical protein